MQLNNNSTNKNLFLLLICSHHLTIHTKLDGDVKKETKNELSHGSVFINIGYISSQI